MTKVSRIGGCPNDENIPDWLRNVLKSICSTDEIKSPDTLLKSIIDKKKETVEDVVNKYKHAVGLSLIDSVCEEETIKIASSSLSPISPMRLKKLSNPDEILKKYDDSDIIVQIKFDGFKTQAIKKEGKAFVFTRRGEDFSGNVDFLVSDLGKIMPNNSFWLGELVWEDNGGKQQISDIQTVVSSSPENAKKKLESKSGKAILYVYDMLWENGKDITKLSYVERYNKLAKYVRGTNVKIAKNYKYGQKDEVINEALSKNAEGIVLKPKQSTYEYKSLGQTEPFGEWAKYKPSQKAHTDEVILKEYKKAKKKLLFPMYQYKGKELFEVGILSGMSKEDEAEIKNKIDNGKMVVVEITYQERMKSGKFRHVGWSRMRPDKSPKNVTF